MSSGAALTLMDTEPQGEQKNCQRACEKKVGEACKSGRGYKKN